MRDSLLKIDPVPKSDYYEDKPAPAGGWPKRIAPTVKSENKLHSNMRKLVEEKDRLIDQGNRNVAEIEKERRWRRFLAAVLAATWATIIYALKVIIPYAIKGLLAR